MQAEGIRIDDSSRFPFYNKLLRAFARQGDTADELPEDAAMRVGIATTEVGELIEALEMLLRPPRVDGWLPRLQVAVGGHAIPVSGPDPARAAVFELVVAASCRKAGANPIFAEPDIKVRVERRTLAIAAKRLLSFAPIEKRTADARKQIARATNDDPDAQGIIAYDLTPALGFDRTIATVDDLHEVGQRYLQTRQRIAEEGRRIGEWASKQPNVRAAAATLAFPSSSSRASALRTCGLGTAAPYLRLLRRPRRCADSSRVGAVWLRVRLAARCGSGARFGAAAPGRTLPCPLLRKTATPSRCSDLAGVTGRVDAMHRDRDR